MKFGGGEKNELVCAVEIGRTKRMKFMLGGFEEHFFSDTLALIAQAGNPRADRCSTSSKHSRARHF
jgi:hypothetical protein